MKRLLLLILIIIAIPIAMSDTVLDSHTVQLSKSQVRYNSEEVFTYLNGRWYNITDAPSLLNSSYKCIVKSDGITNVKCLDYNWTSVVLSDLSVDTTLIDYAKTLNALDAKLVNNKTLQEARELDARAIPIKIKDYKSVLTTAKLVDSTRDLGKTFVINNNLDEVHIGLNSTTITLNSTTIDNIGDSYVDSGGAYVNTNFGSTSPFSAGEIYSSGVPSRALIMWNLSLMSSWTIRSAILNLTVSSSTGNNAVTWTVHTVTQTNWTELGVTWNNKPNFNATQISNKTLTNPAGNTGAEFNVTIGLQQCIAYAWNNCSFLIKYNETALPSTSWIQFRSRESSGKKPALIIDYDTCSPNLTNTSWSDWRNLTCVSSQMNQSRNLTQYDSNYCGGANTTFIETQQVNNWLNTSWSDWRNMSCVSSRMNQSRNLTQYDTYSCGVNVTFIESQSVGPSWFNTTNTTWVKLGCVGEQTQLYNFFIEYDLYYCNKSNTTHYQSTIVDPIYYNTSWSGYLDVGCQGDYRNYSINLTQYDNYSCAASTVFYNYSLNRTLANTSWSDWLNVSCLSNSTMNQTRNLTQYNTYYCGSNTSFLEYLENGSCVYSTGSPGGGDSSGSSNQADGWVSVPSTSTKKTSNLGECGQKPNLLLRLTDTCKANDGVCSDAETPLNSDCKLTVPVLRCSGDRCALDELWLAKILILLCTILLVLNLDKYKWWILGIVVFILVNFQMGGIGTILPNFSTNLNPVLTNTSTYSVPLQYGAKVWASNPLGGLLIGLVSIGSLIYLLIRFIKDTGKRGR